MILLTFDPSLTRTGYAVLKAPPVLASGIETGSFASEDPDAFIDHALALIEQFQPDFMAAEAAHKKIFMYGKKSLLGGGVMVTPNADQLKLSVLQGGLKGIARCKRIPLVLVAAQTWRKAVLGNGNLPRDAAKALAVTTCVRLKIPVKNHDSAEAACVGLWASSCDAFRQHVWDNRRREA